MDISRWFDIVRETGQKRRGLLSKPRGRAGAEEKGRSSAVHPCRTHLVAPLGDPPDVRALTGLPAPLSPGEPQAEQDGRALPSNTVLALLGDLAAWALFFVRLQDRRIDQMGFSSRKTPGVQFRRSTGLLRGWAGMEDGLRAPSPDGHLLESFGPGCLRALPSPGSQNPSWQEAFERPGPGLDLPSPRLPHPLPPQL